MAMMGKMLRMHCRQQKSVREIVRHEPFAQHGAQVAQGTGDGRAEVSARDAASGIASGIDSR